jgi:hypothetical protein
MRIQSGRQVAALWTAALLVFLTSAWASIALHPATPVTAPAAGYYVGLLGLLAIGLALVVTWRWVRGRATISRGTRAMLQTLLIVGAVLWLAAMVFPFL